MHYTREDFERLADRQREQMEEWINGPEEVKPDWDIDDPHYLLFRFDPEGSGKYGCMVVPPMPGNWDLDMQKEGIQKLLQQLTPDVDALAVLAGGYAKDPETMERTGELITIYVEARDGDAVMYVWDLHRHEGKRPTLTARKPVKTWEANSAIGGRMSGYFPPSSTERTLVN